MLLCLGNQYNIYLRAAKIIKSSTLSAQESGLLTTIDGNVTFYSQISLYQRTILDVTVRVGLAD